MVGLATYTLEALCQDVATKKRRKGVPSAGTETAETYKEVWSAFGRYLSACLEQRKGLNLSSFCKIGWQVERKALEKPCYRPLFRFSEQFCRTHMSRETAHRLTAPLRGGAEVCPFEDFNFSKAAIKFSSKLTKDQVSSGLRALVQRLGQAIGAGRPLDVVLGDLGRLVAGSNGDPRFSFDPEVYTREGLEPPPADGASAVAASPPPPPVATFTRAPAASSRSLGVRGQLATQEPPVPSPLDAAPVQSFGSGERPKDKAEQLAEPDEEAQPELEQSSTLRPSSSAPLLSTGSPRRGAAVLTGLQFKREMAYKQAVDRQITEMEARAARAVEEREAWGEHVSACLEQERDAIQTKRVKHLQNLHFLQHQMDVGEQRRREQRKEDIATASAHGFPKFMEPSKEEIARAEHDQKARLRAELDEQVRLNNALRRNAKLHEMDMETQQLEATRTEMRLLRHAEREKRSYDREALLTSWNSDIRMKNVSKAIDEHSKVVPASGREPGSRATTAASSGGLGNCRPLSAGSTASRPSTASSRGLAGSTRRTPLGASRSLGQLAGGAVRAH